MVCTASLLLGTALAWRFLGLGYYVAEDDFTWEEDEHTIMVLKWFEVGLDAIFPELRLLTIIG